MIVSDPFSKKRLSEDGRLRNVSKQGFAMIIPDQLRRGVSYDFLIDLTGNKFQVRGKVLHLRNEWKFFIVGVRTESMSFFSNAQLNRLLASKSAVINKMFLHRALIAGLLIFIGLKFLLSLSLAASLAGGFGLAILLFAFKPF